MPTSKKTEKGAKQMMKNAQLKKSAIYTIDLTQLDGEGTFPCPKCHTAISPDDESEEVYTIVDTKVANDQLVELVISCGTCGSRIKLTGFQQAFEGLTQE
jgi:hypothetical protein